MTAPRSLLPASEEKRKHYRFMKTEERVRLVSEVLSYFLAGSKGSVLTIRTNSKVFRKIVGNRVYFSPADLTVFFHDLTQLLEKNGYRYKVLTKKHAEKKIRIYLNLS